jgi:hypothetical protein
MITLELPTVLIVPLAMAGNDRPSNVRAPMLA